MTRPDAPTKNSPTTGDDSSARDGKRDAFGELLERLSYAVGLGSAALILAGIPALIWERELGQYFNGYLYSLILVVSYFCVPFARRYMRRIK